MPEMTPQEREGYRLSTAGLVLALAAAALDRQNTKRAAALAAASRQKRGSSDA